MNLLRWLSGSRDLVPGMSPDELMWTCVTISLSALIVIGYCIIAIGWYFQSKLARAESTATLSRLLRICVTCGVFGTLFQLMQMPWAVWRIYDAALLLVC